MANENKSKGSTALPDTPAAPEMPPEPESPVIEVAVTDIPTYSLNEFLAQEGLPAFYAGVLLPGNGAAPRTLEDWRGIKAAKELQ